MINVTSYINSTLIRISQALIFFTAMFAASIAFANAGGPLISKTFSPNVIGPESISTITFTIDNSAHSEIRTALSFTDVLPAVPGAMTIADPANISSNCDAGTNGTISAPDGGGTILLSDYQIGAFQTCIITVDVTASTPGVHTNPAITLSSSAGSTMSEPADLTVVTTLPGFTKSFAPSTVPLGGKSKLTFTVDNTSNMFRVGNLDFTDVFPTGMVIADPANASTDCVSARIPNTILTAIPNTSVVMLDANGSNILSDFEVLSAGASCTVSVDVIAEGIGELDNISDLLRADFVVAGKASDTLTSTVTPVAIQKSFVDDPVPPGSNATLEFKINNFDRNFSASSVAFTDDLTTLSPSLAGLTFNSLLSNDCGGTVTGIAGTTINLSGGVIAAEGSCTLRVSLSVPGRTTPGAYTNTTSTVTATANGSPLVGNMASATLFVESTPILTKEFLKAGTLSPDPVVSAGDDVVLRFTITNPSTTSAATDVSFKDQLTDNGPGTGFLPFPVSIPFPSLPFDDPCGAGSSLALVSTLFGGDTLQSLSLTSGTLAAAPDAGSTCSFDITLTVPVDMDPGIKTNTTQAPTATIDGAMRTGSPASDTLTVVAAPTLKKEFIDAPVTPGDTVTMLLTLSYPSDATADATAITFTDDLANLSPALVGLVASGLPLSQACDTDGIGGNPGTGTLSASAGGTLLTFTGGILSPGESCAISVTLDVPASAASGTYINTTSNVSATVSGLTVSSPAANSNLEVGNLLFSKKFLSNSVIPGEALTLRFSLENISTLVASNINFTGNFSAMPNLIATDPALTNNCGGTLVVVTIPNTGSILTYTNGILSAGASCTVDVEVTVPATASDGIFQSVPSAASYTLGATPGFSSPPAIDNLIIDTKNKLSVTKEFMGDTAVAGSTVAMRLTLTNLDSVNSVSDVDLTDNLGAVIDGMEVSSLVAASNCQAFGFTIGGLETPIFSVINGTLPAGASCTVDANVTIPVETANGLYTNTTSAITGLIGSAAVSGSAASDNINVISLDVNFSKAFDTDAVRAGDTTTLTFNITNNSPSIAATSIEFSDNLDATLTGLVATGLPINNICGAGSVLSGTSVLTLTGANLSANGGSCSFDVDLLIPGNAIPGTYTNTTSNLTIQGLTVAGAATDNLTIDPTPPAFTKTFTPDAIVANAISTLHFVINNSSNPLGATALDFTDNMPAGMTVAAIPNVINTCSGTLTAVAGASTISLTGGSVGTMSTCSIMVNITSSIGGAHVNTTGDLSSSLGNSGTATDTLTANDDIDDDTVLNAVDNCPTIANTDQADLDKDGLGDVCDADIDGDLMPNDYEIANGLNPFDPLDQYADLDGDGFTNLEEFKFGTNPNVADPDTDDNNVPDSVDERRKRVVVPPLYLLLNDD